MEMLAEMEGTDEDLKGLNHAEHKPEDDMQTDEWMYELKHRKSWSTGNYVPTDDSWKPARATLTDAQVKAIGQSWEAVSDPTSLGRSFHDRVVKVKKTPGLDKEKQATRLSEIVRSISKYCSTAQTKLVVPEVTSAYDTYGLEDKEVLTVFGESLYACLAEAAGAAFTPEAKKAWTAAYNNIVHEAFPSAKE